MPIIDETTTAPGGAPRAANFHPPLRPAAASHDGIPLPPPAKAVGEPERASGVSHARLGARGDVDPQLAQDEISGRLTVVWTYLLGVAVGTILALAL